MTLPASELKALVEQLRECSATNMQEAYRRNDMHSLGIGANLADSAASALEAMGAELERQPISHNDWYELCNERDSLRAELEDAKEQFEFIDVSNHALRLQVEALKKDGYRYITALKWARGELESYAEEMQCSADISVIQDALHPNAALGNKDLSDRQQQGSMK